MVFRGMIDIVKRLALYRDDVRVKNLENLVRFDRERKTSVSPTEYLLPNFAPHRADWDFNANCPGLVSGRVSEHDVNIAVRFNPYVDSSTLELVPFLFGWQPSFGLLG